MSDDRVGDVDDAAEPEPRSEDGERTGDAAAPTARPASAAARRERRAATSRPAGRTGSTRAGATGTQPDRPREARPTGGSPIARLARFLREVVAELRKVIWPTRRQLVTYTAVVLVFVAFMVAFVSGLDLLFARAVFAVFG